MTESRRPGPSRRALRERLRDLRYLALEVVGWPASIAVLLVALLSLPLAALLSGRTGGAPTLDLVHRLATRAHAAAARFAAAPDRRTTDLGEAEHDLRAPQTRRNLRWLLLHATLVFVVSILLVSMSFAAVLYVVGAPWWWLFPDDLPLSLAFPIESWRDAWLTIGLGLLYGTAAWLLTPWAARRIARGTLAVLERPRSEVLAQRVDALSASRAAALDAHSAELRRIERELHDGAQNRLVSVVMMLGMARRALETDATTALPLLERAQEAAGDALAGLRTAVHDIYPPVLDELGLGDAASSLTSRATIPCTLDVSGLRRAPAAVESAAYFVLAEALTNAMKHSGASRVGVSLRTEVRDDEQVLVVEVRDDGVGGASAEAGSGLAGIARRASAFEGTLHLTSPVGGPTTVKVELPCGS
ncbi:histidine kinase [Nocardioides sp. cx-173]|uniref:sensor histidine kinase n=1 Tax=Nocardioides sp. cx-173 TaxID=2898796 RepID=UPI001E348742|nr:histidine kinase [Nocardioides sp. cx-173]MCD4523536.1 histidine kinase [Nocardioides sp. cx-173]UGB42126.1 histidine kinase [Nocardioides sp. cx-173]